MSSRNLRPSSVILRKGALRVFEIAFIAFLVVLNTVPILWGVLTSIKPAREIFAFPPLIIGFQPVLEHYLRVIQSGFLQSLMVSVINASGCIFFGLLLAVVAGFGFDRYRFRMRKVLFFCVVIGIPLSIGSSALLIPNYLYMTRLGITNNRFTLILLYTTYNLPMAIWILKGAFEAIPREIDEAATLEGCSDMYILFRLLLPLAKPAIAAAALFLFIGSWNEFIAASVMVDSPKFRPVQLAIYNYLGYYGREWGPLTASSILALIPIIFVFIRLGRLLISGLTQGSVKN